MITVAIAEDHELVRSGIALMVDRFANMKVVVTASNGHELIEHFKAIKELPDVAILDVNMPEMNGYDTAIEIRKHFSEVRILALSMHSNEYCVLK
ncbi:MAG: response regulator transcription factor, partial [Taibaiella sp.]|nr:response regulator transcription factor [Taibaiella sp.]